MKTAQLMINCLVLVTLAVGLQAACAAKQVEILRDPWGVPHVFADSDEGALHGLGYATAEDRAFQMTYSLRIIQGRLAEVVGKVKKLHRDETSIDHDKKMRTFGFHRAAERVAGNLDSDKLALLQAYCDGVNAWFTENSDRLPPMFLQTGVEHEPWTPADCLASWWHIGQFFATDGTRDLIASRDRTARMRAQFPQPPADLPQMPPDEAPAVVQRADVSDAWVQQVERYADEHGMTAVGEAAAGPKFSHAWVVGGEKTTTGSSVLVSDPQTPVRNPSLFYEFHICGKSFNARGMGVAGSPIILIGFTDRVAWGMTALGADQADLFLLDTDREHPGAYRFDGRWRPMTVYEESIQVKGAEPIDFRVRETHLGPVATAYCFARPGDGEVALKRIPLCETDRDTIEGALAMMRASDAKAFDEALTGWRFPSANVVFGDVDGKIGYRALGAMPARSPKDPSHGRRAHYGQNADDDWQEMVPHQLQPHVMNPAAGYLYSGNHRTIGSWYPIPIGAMTGTGGDTVRSWRLRERLERRERFTPGQVKAIHFETTNPARRDIVALGLHLEEQDGALLSLDALRSLDILRQWHKDGASSSLRKEGSAVALELSTFFRFVSTHLAHVYGGGESGLAYFLKTATARIADDSTAELTELERQFIDQSLATAWETCVDKYGDDPTTWQQQAREAIGRQQLGYYESLDNFPALDRAEALAMPAL